ncbi:amino acid permease 3-like protein [Tanacetum coccineum]
MLSAAMSFTYSSIGIGLGISKVVENGKIKGSLTGISVGKETLTQKIWRSSQALGAIAFAYSYSLVLIEIQDTIKSQPAEHKTMKKATLISVATMTIFYMFFGCFGYAAFGDMAPGNILTGFGFYNPYWLIDIANGAIVIHLIGAYQVLPQPLFAFVENTAAVNKAVPAQGSADQLDTNKNLMAMQRVVSSQTLRDNVLQQHARSELQP